jgi:hypothetical protein
VIGSAQGFDVLRTSRIFIAQLPTESTPMLVSTARCLPAQVHTSLYMRRCSSSRKSLLNIFGMAIERAVRAQTRARTMFACSARSINIYHMLL